MIKVYLMKEQFIKQTISQDICLVKKLMKYRLWMNNIFKKPIFTCPGFNFAFLNY